MPDTYYYQDASGQIIGPLPPEALKLLANEGIITETTFVRRGEQGEWCEAGTIAGLVTPRAARPDPFATPQPDPAERARQAFQKAEEQAEKMADKLWFLDLKFNHFFTPRLAGALWAIFLCLIAITYLIATLQSLSLLPKNPFSALAGMLLALVSFVFAAVFSRVVVEVLLVIFRIGQRLEDLKHFEDLKHPENRGI